MSKAQELDKIINDFLSKLDNTKDAGCCAGVVLKHAISAAMAQIIVIENVSVDAAMDKLVAHIRCTTPSLRKHLSTTKDNNAS